MADIADNQTSPVHVRGTILVVDDDASLRSMMREVIEAEFRCDVAEACNGQEALDILAAGLDPEMLVCDIRMPVMDGFELLRLMRNDKRLRQPPVVLCSTIHDRDTIIQAAHLPVAGYILKPFETSTLIGKLNEILRPKQGVSIDGGIDGMRLRLKVTVNELPQYLGWLIEDLEQCLHRCRLTSTSAELHYRLFHLHGLTQSFGARAVQQTIESARSQLADTPNTWRDTLKPVEDEVTSLLKHVRSLEEGLAKAPMS